MLLGAWSVGSRSTVNVGPLAGTVVDPSGAVVAKAEVTLRNAVSGYMQSTVSAADGSFRFTNIPPNPYRLEVKAAGFNVFSETVDIRNSLTVQVKAALAAAGSNTTVVEESTAETLET